MHVFDERASCVVYDRRQIPVIGRRQLRLTRVENIQPLDDRRCCPQSYRGKPGGEQEEKQVQGRGSKPGLDRAGCHQLVQGEAL